MSFGFGHLGRAEKWARVSVFPTLALSKLSVDQISINAGCSIIDLKVCRNLAPVAPSMTR